MSALFEGIDFSGFAKVEKHQNETQTKPDTVGGQAELSLADVIEDPDQPRRSFDQQSLEELADSIKKRGVVQPIIVRPKNAEGLYVIVMGARRYRASQLAKMSKIPAVIRVKPSDGYDQMIENIQRENLGHADIANFVEQEIKKGEKAATIASFLGKSRSWVSVYSSFQDMHPVIKGRVEDLGIRVAYELHQAMLINDVVTLAYMAENEQISQRSATALAKSLKGIVSSELNALTLSPEADESVNGTHAKNADSTADRVESLEAKRLADAPNMNVSLNPKRSLSGVALIVKVNERVGRLITDQAAKQGSQFGLVSFDNGANIEEVVLSEITLLEILQLV